jgi:hypothetical protein
MTRGVRTSDLACVAVVKMQMDDLSPKKIQHYVGVPKRSQEKIWKRFYETGDPTVPPAKGKRGRKRALSTVEVLVHYDPVVLSSH